jgi:flagellar protein FliT
MTSNEMLTTYAALSELTDSMLSAARQGEWEHLTALEQNCRSHVGALMQAAPVKLSETEQRTKVATIRAILQNDAKIRALIDPHMNALQQRLSMARAGQRGAEAYGAQRM